MEYELYVIYDAATNMYGVPMAQNNDAEAMRSFAHETMKEDSIWHSHPSDFILYKIGIYNTGDGTIQAFQSPERVCAAIDFVNSKKGTK